MEWILQSLVGTLAWALIAGALTLLIAYLKRKGSKWAMHIFYGVITSGALFSILYVVSSPPTNALNVKSRTKSWLSSLGFKALPIELPDAAFAYTVTTPMKIDIVVFCDTKSRPQYLVVQTDLFISQQDKMLLDSLPAQRTQEVAKAIPQDLN